MLRGHGVPSDLTILDNRRAKAGWALISLRMDSTVTRTLWLKVERLLQPSDTSRDEWISFVHVRVPPERLTEADSVVGVIARRCLG
jgi:hypothetical protein